MKIKVKVTTPEGSAKKVLPKLRYMVFGLGRRGIHNFEAYTNKEGNTMYLEIEGTVKKVMEINRNLARFDIVMGTLMRSKKVRKMAGFKSSEEKDKEIEDLLSNHTKLDIIKAATADEIVEANKTFWQRMKEKFNKVKEEEE